MRNKTFIVRDLIAKVQQEKKLIKINICEQGQRFIYLLKRGYIE